MKYLIKNGRLIDPLNDIDEICDIFISDGKIDKIGKNLNLKAEEIIDAGKNIVAPGLIDLHVHLREPGREDEETVMSGTRAAIRGGFTSIACMPNTEPPIDNPAAIKSLKEIIAREALCGVYIIGAITEGRLGKKLADFKAMKIEGAVGVSDDGVSVWDKELMLEALKRAKEEPVLVIEHCEDPQSSLAGVMNQGFAATRMGLRGIPGRSEYEMVRRDLELAKEASSRIHIAHVSCKESVELIRKAKRSGVRVTAESAPHHFSLTEECCATYDTNMKMNPPLRTKEDVAALKEGLADGTIDAVATDHAPHTDSEKDVEFDFAPFGVIGLESALSLAVMELVDTKVLSWNDLIMRMSVNPAKILRIDRGSLKEGAVADMVVIDPEKDYVYTRSSIESKSKNSPFIGWKLKAKVSHVFVGGKCRMKNGVII